MESPPFLSNDEIADRLASLAAQLLSSQKENPYGLLDSLALRT